MKKIILLLITVFTMLLVIKSTKNEYVIIPNEAIRFRIIPNSNTLEDISMKEKVKTEISSVIKEIETSNSIDETRKSIVNNIPLIEDKINNLFVSNNYNQTFKINYGINHFPEKEYKGVLYEEGDYESMVIEIGSSSGDNYWCVLFPPLCMIEAEDADDVEYSFFISEIINKYFK